MSYFRYILSIDNANSVRRVLKTWKNIVKFNTYYYAVTSSKNIIVDEIIEKVSLHEINKYYELKSKTN